MSGSLVLPPEREGHIAPPDIAARRATLAQALERGIWTTDPPPREEAIAGVRILRWLPEAAPRGRVIHFHGGGYRMGCPEMEGPYALALAKTCGVEVIVPQYRLAPEHPFPAALVDALAVFRGTADDLPLFLSGGSAGGGIAAALALLARDAGRGAAGLILHSPWLDTTVTAASYDGNAASDPLFSREAAEQGAGLLLQGHDPRDPLASPLFAEPEGLPPVLVTVGTGEVLLDDATRYAARLERAGIPVRLLALPGMDHVAVTRAIEASGAAQCLAATVGFIDELSA